MRYQTAPRPEGVCRPSSQGSGQAGDGTRTRSSSLEGSRATGDTSPARSPIIGSAYRLATVPAGTTGAETTVPQDGSSGRGGAHPPRSSAQVSPLVTDRPIVRARRLVAVAALFVIAAALVAALATHRAEGATGKNVLFILTDDQTATELSGMPNTQALLATRASTSGGPTRPIPSAARPAPPCSAASTCTTTASAGTSGCTEAGGASSPMRPTRCRCGPAPPATTTSTSAST